jgi:hypothetical protein
VLSRDGNALKKEFFFIISALVDLFGFIFIILVTRYPLLACVTGEILEGVESQHSGLTDGASAVKVIIRLFYGGVVLPQFQCGNFGGIGSPCGWCRIGLRNLD